MGKHTCIITYYLDKIMDIPTAALYCQLRTLHGSRTKFLIRNFTEVLIRNFIPDWESKFVNQPDPLANFSENVYAFPKMRAVLVSPKDFFQESGNLLRKVYKMRAMIQNSGIKGYHEFHGR